MLDFKEMKEDELRSFVRKVESDIEEIEHKYHKEMEYESEQEALLDSANCDSKLQGILCESLDMIANIKQRRFEIMDDLHNDKQNKIRESEENIQEARKQIYS